MGRSRSRSPRRVEIAHGLSGQKICSFEAAHGSSVADAKAELEKVLGPQESLLATCTE